MNHRTDTIRLPRIVATASAPLTPPARRPWRAVAVVVVLFAVALAAVVAVGRALAWTEQPATPATPVLVTDLDPDALADLADLASQHDGTDAGLITEPAR